jgi:hypothetical protein
MEAIKEERINTKQQTYKEAEKKLEGDRLKFT